MGLGLGILFIIGFAQSRTESAYLYPGRIGFSFLGFSVTNQLNPSSEWRFIGAIEEEGESTKPKVLDFNDEASFDNSLM